MSPEEREKEIERQAERFGVKGFDEKIVAWKALLAKILKDEGASKQFKALAQIEIGKEIAKFENDPNYILFKQVIIHLK